MEVQTFKRVTSAEEKKETILRLPAKTDVIPSLIMLFLGRASIVGMYPFACAYFAASFDKHTAYIGILAMLCGIFTSGEGIGGVRYIFAAMIYWLYSYIKDDHRNITMSAIVCAAGVFICGGMFLPYTNPSLYGAIQLFAESILTGFLYISFHKAGKLVKGRESRTQISQEEIICLAICVGGFIKGFSGSVFYEEFEISHLLTMYAIIVISMYASMGTSVIGAILIGICTSADNGNALYLVGLYGLCAVFSAMLKSFGRAGSMIGFLGGGVMGLLFTGNVFDFPVRLSELLVSCAMFMITPKKLLREMGSFLTRTFHSEALRTDLRVKGYLCERLTKISESFRSLEQSFYEFSQHRNNKSIDTVGGMIDAVADNVCKSCGMCRQCWQPDFDATYDTMLGMFNIMEEKGYCDRSNAPDMLVRKCVRLDSMIDEFVRVYELYKNREIWYNENKRARDLVMKQYGEISDVLDALSFDIENGFSFLDDLEDKLIEVLDQDGIRVREVSVVENGAGSIEVFVKAAFGTNIKALSKRVSQVMEVPMELRCCENGMCRFTSKCEYTVEVSTLQKAKTGEKKCGDSIVHFRTDDNRYCVVICDGMGSGESAEEDSRFSVEMLKEFLKSGISERTAVEIINSALSLKSAKESFSTIDIFVFDLNSGFGEFIKIGGAESYIKSNGDIDVVVSKTLPAGILKDICTQTYKYDFKNGDVIVMASDGVTDINNENGDWIKGILQNESDTEVVAESILKGASKKSGGKYPDDMTVAAIKIKRTA